MNCTTLSRRSFVKMAAAAAVTTGMAASLGAGGLAKADETAKVGETKRVRTCCRGCGKMECGVWVTVVDGRAVKVEGDTSCFTSGGNCCAKSQSSIQAAYHPDRLLYPLKRTNPAGSVSVGMRLTR